MVDVTILLYLPLDTSLDDLSFLAEWGVNIVGQVEEKMILAGKEARYIRHRVLPIMYKEHDPNAKVKTDLSGATALPWENRAIHNSDGPLPAWVKVHTHSSNNTSEASDLDEDSDSCTCDKLTALTISTNKTGGKNNKNNTKKSDPNSFVETIRRAVDFQTAEKTPSRYNCHSSDSESDSMYSDSCNSSMNSSRVNQSVSRSKSSREVVRSVINANVDRSASCRVGYNGTFSGSWAHKMKRASHCPSVVSTSTTVSSAGSSQPVNNHKHVILSLATGYDRDSLKEVRQIVNNKGVALLPVGLGDRGMIGLGGYYIKDLNEIQGLQDKIIQRLTHLV